MTIKLEDGNGNEERIEIELDSEGNIVDTDLGIGHHFCSTEIETAWKDDLFEQYLFDNLDNGTFAIDGVSVTIFETL